MSFTDAVRKALGLSENATDDEAARVLSERLANRPPVGPGVPSTGTTPAPQANGGIDVSNLSGDARVLAEQFNAQFTQLSEKIAQNQRTQLLGNLMSQQFSQLSELLEGSQQQVRTAQAQALTEKLTSTNGKKYALPATIQDRLRTQLLSDSPDAVPLNDVVAMLTELTEKGLVPLGEQSTNNPKLGEEQQPASQGATTNDPQGEFLKLAEELQKADAKLSDVDAFTLAAEKNPQLYNLAYRNSAFIEGAVK